ncbi:heme NO-binding domain-containing protein [Pseudooceanicola sp. CBS1P-1]|uniref:Heme NO-binding protein n=1 Tax=Pseudooceanicola albus TaxID=2692189 RepID=A0A6L7FY32_9RHOB|nr:MULTISPECIES: heme NO-binding domain-containing protein [Pseudooceanicola]MBT9383452.1 heme NO-binding domain-containing protein [Pseudooceanicola endophyticus]MXN16226.1 heme NO-binding protein [Pseudooceanicola albus]
MHGLINRSIECFLRDTYGVGLWADVALRADLPGTSFEAMLSYEDALTWRVLEAAEALLKKPRAVLLEDVGTYLVSHANNEGLRRLLRFAGVGYEDFLHSLDDLPDRARLAVGDLMIPPLELSQQGDGRFVLRCGPGMPGFGHALIGVLRAMADDYGALVMLDHLGSRRGIETIEIRLVERAFTEGREFELGARTG